MDLSDLIDRNAAFAPDKPAIRFGGAALTYAASRRAHRAGGARAEIAARRRRAATASRSSRSIIPTIWCCSTPARGSARCWCRSTGGSRCPSRCSFCRDASVKALVVEQGFAPVVAPLKQALPDVRIVGLDFAPGGPSTTCSHAGSGDGRNPHVDLSSPLLIVYTSGTTGRPKGAVLRQEALLWNAVMSQHMHDMTAADHVLTVLPLFHVGGLNIQTTPALQLGATVTLHPRFAPDATLEAIARDTPTLTVLVPATMQAVIEHPRWAATDSTACARSPPARRRCRRAWSMPSRRAACRCCRSTARPRPARSRSTRAPAATSAPGSTGLPGLVCEARIVDDAGNEVAPGVAGEVVVRGPQRVLRVLGQRGGDRRDVARRLVSFRRHRHARRRRAFLHPRPQEEHDHLGRREHLSGRGRARAARASRGRGGAR